MARMMRKSNHARSPSDAAAIASVGLLTTGSPRTRSRRPGRRDDCIRGAAAWTRRRSQWRSGATAASRRDSPPVCWRERSAVATPSPSAGSRPSSGCVGSDAWGGARGALSVPTSPSAGVRPIRRRPSGPSPDRASMLSRTGIARSNTISPFAKSRLRRRVGGRAIWVSCERAGPWSLTAQWLPGRFHAGALPTYGRPSWSKKDRQLQANPRWAVLGSNQ